MLTSIISYAENFFGQIKFDYLVFAVWASFAALFLITLVATLLSRKIRVAKKRPFLCLVNAYSGVNLALFLIKYELSQSVFFTAVFWVIGYMLYGLLCAVTKPASTSAPRPQTAVLQPVLQAAPAPASVSAHTVVIPEVPAAKNNVRLDHALSLTDKLLTKNLGKSDRQDLERLKNTLAVMQIKGALSPAETDILNDNFNALLKLMAKYNL